MKIIRLFSLAGVLLLASVVTFAAYAFAAPPAEIIVPSLAALFATASVACWTVRHQLMGLWSTVIAPALSALAFPAPLTGTPPATAFA